MVHYTGSMAQHMEFYVGERPVPPYSEAEAAREVRAYLCHNKGALSSRIDEHFEKLAQLGQDDGSGSLRTWPLRGRDFFAKVYANWVHEPLSIYLYDDPAMRDIKIDNMLVRSSSTP